MGKNMIVAPISGAALRTGNCSRKKSWLLAGSALIASGAALSTPAFAQAEVAASQPAGAPEMQDIIVTATKRGRGEVLQRVPIAAAVFNEAMLQAKQFQSIHDLTYSIPNVKIDSIGSYPAYATLSFRGFTTTTSIPSIDPAVGIFIDGNYIGVSAGALTDSYDIAGVEVLRGPQGILFGRNVTGGALIVNSREPKDDFGGYVGARAEVGTYGGGLVTSFQGAVTGPLIKGVLDARIAGIYKYDSGFFPDSAPSVNRNVGRARTVSIRPSLKFTPTEDLDSLLRVQYYRSHGDGAVAYQKATISQGFRSIEGDPGISNVDSFDANLTTNYHVPFGQGVITDILAYRKVKYDSRADVAGIPQDIFPLVPGGKYILTSRALTKQWQISNELRYSGSFFDDRLTTTEGLYFFHDHMFYGAENNVLQTPTTGGGLQNRTTVGVFTSNDFRIVENLTLNAGLRYTYEKKNADITLVNTMNRCPIAAEACSGFDSSQSNISKSWSPKIGLTWQAQPSLMFYGYWARAQRSGGFNLRSTSPVFQAFGPEKNETFEIGAKSQLFDNRVRFNVALFRSKWKAIQETQALLTNTGSQTFFTNGADALLKGVEAELTVSATKQLTLNASLGYLDAHYTNVLVDLTGDKVINSADYKLKLPFAPKWTANLGGSYDIPLSGRAGSLTLRANYSYRSMNFFDIANRGPLNAANLLESSLVWHTPVDGMSVTIFGKNLLNNVITEASAPLPNPFAGTSLGPNAGQACFCTIAKGRTVGAEFNYNF